MSLRYFFLAVLLLLAGSAGASEPAFLSGPQVGDCVVFREGGGGRLFKAPVYWLKGTIEAMSVEQRQAGRCPEIGKPLAAQTREDWVRIAASTPCVQMDSEVRQVDVLRIRFRVDEWETPWSLQHGSTGWLFRGQFLNKTLKNGEIIDMNATWLERCEPLS